MQSQTCTHDDLKRHHESGLHPKFTERMKAGSGGADPFPKGARWAAKLKHEGCGVCQGSAHTQPLRQPPLGNNKSSPGTQSLTYPKCLKNSSSNSPSFSCQVVSLLQERMMERHTLINKSMITQSCHPATFSRGLNDMKGPIRRIMNHLFSNCRSEKKTMV